MKILTSPIVLLFVLVPFLGLSQSQRKINKALKSDYAVQLQMYDSLMHKHDSIIQIYSSLFSQYEALVTKKRSQRRVIQNKKHDAINQYKKLIQLEVAKSLRFTFQALDSISIPNEIDEMKSHGTTRAIPRQEWSLSLDKLTNKEQNERLLLAIEGLKIMNPYIVQKNQEKVELILELVEKQQELALLGASMDLTNILLTFNLNYLLEQIQLARDNFRAKGPNGFNEFYFDIFPEVFPTPIQYDFDDVASTAYSENDDFKEPEKTQSKTDKNEPEVYTYVDEPASFNGEVKQYLAANIVYPKRALEVGLQGKCFIQFIVSTSGDISNIVVRRGVPDCPECDEEASRVIKGMPKWNPGKYEGVAVNSTFNLPIHFKLSTE